MNRRLIFTTSAEIVRVPPESVVYISADGNYSDMTMADGGTKESPSGRFQNSLN